MFFTMLDVLRLLGLIMVLCVGRGAWLEIPFASQFCVINKLEFY